MNKTFTMILLVLMLSQFVSPHQDINTNPIDQEKIEPLSKATIVQQLEILNSQKTSESTQIRSDLVVFAEDEEKYNLLNQLSYSKKYDNLLAIRIRVTETEKSIITEFSKSIYPFHMYSKASIPSYKIPDSNLELNGENEADLLGVSKLWDLGYNGQDVVVGVIDNGIDFSHPDLSSAEFASKNFTIPGATINYWHGTSVAGTIVSSGASSSDGKAIGNAFGATIASANMGQSTEGYLVGDFLDAFDWLANITEMKVINTSWSGGGEDIWIPVVQRLEQLGIIVVGAAGNEGPGMLNTLGSPANTVHGLSVASQSINGIASSFSSEGPSGGGFTKPDVSSFGQSIVTTNINDGYQSATGTSFSAPLVAGAVATIISGLENDSIPYNVGSLKSAIMATATKNNGALEHRVGQGLVNATAAYNLLVERAGNNTTNVATISFATPTEGFFSQLTNLRLNTQSQIPFTLISSIPGSVTLTTQGNISSIMNLPSINNNLFSQLIFIETNTNGADMGLYTGNISIADLVETFVIPIQVKVNEAPSYKVLFDLRYTSADVGYTVYRAGYKTGTLIEAINQDGGWVDLVDEVFTLNLLTKYDLVWLPDPLGVNAAETALINEQEIEVIHDYVSDGGNLFIHYFGKFNDSLANSVENSIVGTDVTQLNKILNPYEMQASDSLPDVIKYFGSEDSPSTQSIYNASILGKGVSKITSYLSTPIHISGNAISVSSNNHIATWSTPNTGRVLVSSTDSWFSSDNAINNPSSNDFIFMQNVIDWLTSYPRLKYDNYQSTTDSIEMDISISNQTGYLDILPHIQISSDSTISPVVEFTTSSVGQYHYTISFNEDGPYVIEIYITDDYLVFPIVIDSTAPEITILGDILDRYEKNDRIVHDFSIVDKYSEINETSIIVQIDDVIHNEYYFNVTENTLILEFSPNFFEAGSHDISIEASDTFNNTAQLVYDFRIFNTLSDNESQLIAYYVLIGLLLVTLIPIGRKFYRNKK